MVKKSERPFQPEEVAVYRKQFSDLLIRIRAYTEPDTGLLNAAFSIAERCHYGVRRKTGEPYICHPLSVAAILADIEVDNDVIAAGILHDVLEDTPMTFSEMEDLLGHRVASLVEAVTDIDNAIDEVSEMLKEDVDIMSDSKLITSIRRNPQALYIKVADRIHNLRHRRKHRHFRHRHKQLTTENMYTLQKVACTLTTIKLFIRDVVIFQGTRLVPCTPGAVQT